MNRIVFIIMSLFTTIPIPEWGLATMGIAALIGFAVSAAMANTNSERQKNNFLKRYHESISQDYEQYIL